jgi:class 3 adenylate cyclase/tetratricopeptide (TPR) repeat protein
VTSSLERFVPRVAAEWDLDNPGAMYREIDGTLCFVDISGFTNLSEKLARRGRIGAEELTEVLDRVFGEMLRLAYDRGGSLLKFGGDALLLMFEGTQHPTQAISAAIEMRAALRDATQISTSVGRIHLRMSVGLHSGPIDLYLVGGSHRELVVTGSTATTTTEMEGTANAGEILISPALAGRLPASAVGDAKGPGWLLRRRTALADPVGPLYRTPVHPDELARRIPTVLRSHLSYGAAEPEHRVVTVAFLKFKGVEAAMAAGGRDLVAEGLDELVRVVQEAVDEESVTFLATDIDADGGKIILTSGAPSTQVDDEGRVLRAVRRIADRGTALPLKIGVNRGHVFAGEIGTPFRSTYTVMGDTVNLAARLMATAPAGQVYAAPAALDRARTVFATTALEPFMVKGKSEPVQAFAVGAEIGTRAQPTGGGLAFHGREAEVTAIRTAIEQADSGPVMTIVGDVGIGKTRLVNEALAGSEIDVLRIQGEANGADNPYWALRDPLRKLLGIERKTQNEMAARLKVVVADLDRSLLPMLPLLGDITHIDIPETSESAAIEPRFRPDRAAATLSTLLAAIFTGPLVIVAEDRHWLDEATVALLNRLAAEPHARLMLMTTRPPVSGWTGDLIELEPLPSSAAHDIAVTATEATPLRPHDLEAIVTRAGGNPLFLEEILRLVRETGSAEVLPESLDAVVGAEIDTLPPLARRLLRFSSVLGRSFRKVVLDELLEPEGVELDASTREALSRFIISDGPERWRFRHAVMHAAAYEGLSYRRRKELHARAGRVIERLAGTDTSSSAEFLALHFSQAGEHGQAWRYGMIAGDKARRAFANVEAAGHYRRALKSTRWAPDATRESQLHVWTALGDVQEQAGEFEAARQSFGMALKLLGNDDQIMQADLLLRRARAKMRAGQYAHALGDITRGRRIVDLDTREALAARARLDSFAAAVRVSQERFRDALRLARAAAEAAESSNEREALGRAYVVLDWAHYMLGEAAEAKYGERALEIFRESGQPDRAADVMINLGAWAYYEGRWDDAVNWYEGAQAESKRAGNDIAAATAAANMAELTISQRRFDEAEAVIRESVRTFRAAGDPYSTLFAEIQLGRLMLGRGEWERATELLGRLRDDATSMGQISSALEVTAHRAMALVGLGEAERALAEIDEAERQAGEEAELLQAGVAHGRAIALLAIGRVADALTQIEVGLDCARANGLAYDEALLLDLKKAAGESLPDADAERLASLRIQLGLS